MTDIKYFHELTDDEYKALMDGSFTWEGVAKLHPQPQWCGYPDALAGAMGCWSLVHRDKPISKAWCSTCECYKETSNA